jgi:hypothetical protein
MEWGLFFARCRMDPEETVAEIQAFPVSKMEIN